MDGNQTVRIHNEASSPRFRKPGRVVRGSVASSLQVAMLQDDWWPEIGGGPLHVRDLSIALAEQFDCTVDIFTRRLVENGSTYEDSESFVDGQVTVHRVGIATHFQNPLGRLSSLIALLPMRRLASYDVIHGHAFLPAVPTRLAGALGEVPTVFTVHGTALTTGVGQRRSSVLNTIERLVERQLLLKPSFDHVLTVNREHEPLLAEHHNSVTCIPNGVDISRFSRSRDPESGRIVFVGRLTQEKRVADLIDALPQVIAEHEHANLVVVGTGPEAGRLRERAVANGVRNAVEFVGRVQPSKTTDYYASAELFVLPSIREGHPLTLLEAWAMGLPVVTTDAEGIAEFVSHRETAYVVPPCSPDELAMAINYTFAHPDKARSWAKAAKAEVHDKYTWGGAAEKVFDVYQQVQ